MPAANVLQELLGLLAEERDQDELLLARRETLRLLATSSADGGSSASGMSSLTSATARATVASIALGGTP